MTLGELFEMRPQSVEKTAALAFIPSEYAGPDARKRDAQEKHGSYVALVADYDGGCEKPTIAIPAALEEFTRGGPWGVYTTVSSRPDRLRLRIIIPLAEAAPFKHWRAGQELLHAHLLSRGIPTDASARKAAQLSFAPNDPLGGFRRRLANPDAPALSFSWPELKSSEMRAERCERHANTGNNEPIGEQDSDDAIERAIALLEARKPAVEGHGGDAWTVMTANLVGDLSISADMCHELMAAHWNDRCSPPWELDGPNSLRTKVDSAYGSRQSPVGCASPEAEFDTVAIPPIERRPRLAGKWSYRHGDGVAFDKQWLLYRRLPLVGTMMIVGPSGGGKTFFCADLARAIAKGEPFFGVEPDQRGGVALFAAEGVAGMPGRLSVLGDAPLPIWGEPVANLRSKEEQRRISALLDDANAECLKEFGCPIRVIAIDTLAASGLLEDENDNGECARAVKFLEQLAAAHSCLVIVTHHPPKNGNGARGGSALHAGFDTVVEIHHDGKQPVRRAECTKSRDAPTGDWGCFRLEQHVLGFDDRGREVTTCTLCVATADARSAAALFINPELTDAIVEAMGDQLWRKDHQSNETSIIDLIAKCGNFDTGTEAGLRTAKQHLAALLASGIVVEDKERIGGKDRPVIRVPREAILSQ
jgi:hypothetical protein